MMPSSGLEMPRLLLGSPQSETRLQEIVSGKDPEFDSIILNRVESIPDLVPIPYDILLEGHPRGTGRYEGIFLIKGR